MAGADASVELVVTARTGDGQVRPIGAHQWLLSDGHLFALGPDGERTTLDAGEIAHELIFLVTGAHAMAAPTSEVQA